MAEQFVTWTTNTLGPHQKLVFKTYICVIFFKNDLHVKELREIKLLGKATLHMVFHNVVDSAVCSIKNL